MTVVGHSAPDAALETLFVPFGSGELSLPEDGGVLFLQARDGFRLREMAQPGWLCEQGFRPFADDLLGSGLSVGEPPEHARYRLVLVLPPRQREHRRAVFARALLHAAGGGTVVACVPNNEGARSAQDDLARLAGAVRCVSKHKCRVFWTRADQLDPDLCRQWLALDEPRPIADGYLSRPGLFAWDRVDRASALLAEHLPADMRGRVADLGAGYGYLSCRLIAQCPQITALDLYEADARALPPARQNLEQALQQAGRRLPVAVHWHDVTRGLDARYDAIVSNPPFHQGRADLPELGRAFIARAADALQPEGRLWLVANRHLPYESMLAARFAQVRTVATQDGFKVIEGWRVHA